MSNTRKATLLLNLHREGVLAYRTLRYLVLVQEKCLSENIDLGFHIVLDNPDQETLGYVHQFEPKYSRVKTSLVDFKNLGKSRTYGVKNIDDEIVLFLDGDDFISLNWYSHVIDYLSEEANYKHICHTQYFVGFGDAEFIRLGIDSRDPDFDYSELSMDWFFCNNLACRKSTLLNCPVEAYDHASGFGAEDWHWSAETLLNDYPHVIIPNTYYLYRIKPKAFSLGNAGDFIPKPSKLFSNPGPSLKSVEKISAETTREHYETWSDTLTFKEQNSHNLKTYCNELIGIEPALSWVLELPKKPIDVIIPSVNKEIVGLYRKATAHISQGLPTEIFLIDIENFPGGWDVFSSWVELHNPSDRVSRIIFVDGYTDSKPLETPYASEVIDLSKLNDDWKSDLHISRMIARLIVDNSPDILCVHSGKRILSWLERYKLQIQNTANLIFNIVSSPMPDPFGCEDEKALSHMIKNSKNLYLSPQHFSTHYRNSVTKYMCTEASMCFLNILLGRKAKPFSLYDYSEIGRRENILSRKSESVSTWLLKITEDDLELSQSEIDLNYPTEPLKQSVVLDIDNLQRLNPSMFIVVTTNTLEPSHSIIAQIADSNFQDNVKPYKCFLPRHTIQHADNRVLAVFNKIGSSNTDIPAELLVHDMFILSVDAIVYLLKKIEQSNIKSLSNKNDNFKAAIHEALISKTLHLDTLDDNSFAALYPQNNNNSNHAELIKYFAHNKSIST